MSTTRKILNSGAPSEDNCSNGSETAVEMKTFDCLIAEAEKTSPIPKSSPIPIPIPGATPEKKSNSGEYKAREYKSSVAYSYDANGHRPRFILFHPKNEHKNQTENNLKSSNENIAKMTLSSQG